MNFLILFVIFLTLCEEMVNLQTLTKKTPLSIYEYSFDLQPPWTKTIFLDAIASLDLEYESE